MTNFFGVIAIKREIVVFKVDFFNAKVFLEIFNFGDDFFGSAKPDTTVVKPGTGTERAHVGTTSGGNDNANGKVFGKGAMGSFGIIIGINLFPIGDGERIEVFDSRSFYNWTIIFKIFERVDALDRAIFEIIFN